MSGLQGKFSLFFLLVMLGLSLSGLAHAQKIMQVYEKPLPAITLIPEADFDKTSNLFEGTPRDDETLAYSVRLPKDWVKEEDAMNALFGLSNRVLTELVRYNSPARMTSDRSYFSVQALLLDTQITTIQWFLPWAQERGLTLEGFRKNDDGSIDAMYVVLQGDTTYLVRMKAQINGKNMIVVEYYSPSDVWQDEKRLQASVLHSFKLTNQKTQLIETMETHTFLDLAEFSYPVSWHLQAQPVRSADHMAARIIKNSPTRALNGQIDVNLVSQVVVESLPDEIEKFKKDLEVTGLLLNEKIEKKTDYNLDESVKFALVESYKATDSRKRLVGYELWLAVMSAGDYYYFITLLTPSRDDDYAVWAYNSEIFRVVLESVKPRIVDGLPVAVPPRP